MRVVFQFQKKLFHVSVLGSHEEVVVAWGNYFIDADDEDTATSCAVDQFWHDHEDALSPKDMDDAVMAQVTPIALTDGRFGGILEAGHETHLDGFAQQVVEVAQQDAEEIASNADETEEDSI